MKEQLERDIKVLGKVEVLLGNDLTYDTYVRLDLGKHFGGVERARKHLESELKSLEAKEQKDTDLLKESIDLVSKAEELAFKTSITDRQSLSNQFFRLKNRLGALKHKSKVKEQREFKNKDFHVKVWQDSEKIGIETVWIREGYRYVGEYVRNVNRLVVRSIQDNVTFYRNSLPDIGKGKDSIMKSIIGNRCHYSYSDIVTELEKADKLSKEVSIWDVIEECKGVTDREEMTAILNKYEYINDVGQVYSQYLERILDNPIAFIYNGNQLRLKEEK